MTTPPPPPPRADAAARILSALHLFYADNPVCSAELNGLLAWIYEQNAGGRTVCSTDLVRERRFGTLPTVTARISQLTDQGLIYQDVGRDRRVKLLKLTPAGEQVLEERGALMIAATGA